MTNIPITNYLTRLTALLAMFSIISHQTILKPYFFYTNKYISITIHLRNENKVAVPVKVNPLFHSHILACIVHRETAEPQPSTLECDATLSTAATFPEI
jgi:hypothetical protein